MASCTSPATVASCRCFLPPSALYWLRKGWVLSFSMCGLSFPAMAMHPVLQGLANLFPLRHYFLIYVDQALNGYPMIYSWINYVALLIFMMLPFFVVHRLKEALIYYKYVP